MLMRHIRGGWHNATAQEVEEMKKSGWVESSEEERRKIIDAKKAALSRQDEPESDLVHRGQVPEAAPIPNADEREPLVALYLAKLGKKPHPKMKLETLREAVKD